MKEREQIFIAGIVMFIIAIVSMEVIDSVLSRKESAFELRAQGVELINLL